jgi:hypothetical protein
LKRRFFCVSYDAKLDARIANAIAPLKTVRNKMFGKACCTLRGDMMAGVYKDSLVLRLGRRPPRRPCAL